MLGVCQVCNFAMAFGGFTALRMMSSTMVWVYASREWSVTSVGQSVLPELETFEGIQLSNAKKRTRGPGIATAELCDDVNILETQSSTREKDF